MKTPHVEGACRTCPSFASFALAYLAAAVWLFPPSIGGIFTIQRGSGCMFDVAIPSFSLGDRPYSFLFWCRTFSVLLWFLQSCLSVQHFIYGVLRLHYRLHSMCSVFSFFIDRECELLWICISWFWRYVFTSTVFPPCSVTGSTFDHTLLYVLYF